MANEIKMPQLSDTMYSGKILAWSKNVGDVIKRGDVLAEVETDKANLEIESFHSGVLLEIRTPANSTANVGDIIAVLGEAGESVGTTTSSSSKPAAPAAVEKAVPSPEAPQAAGNQMMTSTPSPMSPPPASSNTTSMQSSITTDSDRIVASPLAKKIAQTHSVDLGGLTGTGPNGRIVKKDVEGAIGNAAVDTRSAPQMATTAKTSATITPIQASAGQSMTPLSKMRETIARRMQESVNENPHFYVTIAVRMEQVQKLRELLKEKPEYKGISVNHFVIKACAYALTQEPRVNYAYRDGHLFNPGAVNIGIITSIPDGLLIPVIKEANTLSLKDIVFEAKAAVERAKAGRPTSADLTGGTFSISNMGMLDVENFTAIINPGQGGVIAISAVKEAPVVEKGVVVPGFVMKATVSVDHRVIDGIMAANFLKYFKEGLENPALLMN